MSNKRKTRREAGLDGNWLFRRIEAQGVAAGKVSVNTTGRTVMGTVLSKWMESISSPEGILPHCQHVHPGMASILCTDDPNPMVHCGRCAEIMFARLSADHNKHLCYLCGNESDLFTDFAVECTWNLVILGWACPSCYSDIRRGRPSPTEGT